VFSGRPLTVPWAFERVPAVLAAWFPGRASRARSRGAQFLAKRIQGGKLVRELAEESDARTFVLHALSTGRPAGQIDLTRPAKNGDEKFVSRYIDEAKQPRQFPRCSGYGLSYTSYRYGIQGWRGRS